MKKVGIITMHRIINYGSALQAYATLKSVSKLGYKAELIDYIFPNKKKYLPLSIKIKDFILKSFLYLFYGNKKGKFNSFYKKYYNCSPQFVSPKDLKDNCLPYDILLTGSDQVWNPMHIGDDFSFLLSFCTDDTPKISYASSFSKSVLPNEYKEAYAECLAGYKHISVREKSGVNIVRELTGKSAFCVCDPTLLLSKEEWIELACQGEQIIKGSYILLYILTYAYNPYPEILNIIEYVKKQINLPIVILDGSLKTNKIEGVRNIKNAGPLEFLRLIKDAAFIVTTSFHGTAFALNFEKPFFSVLSDKLKEDTRMFDLLCAVGANDRALIYKSSIINSPISMDYSVVTPRLNALRRESYKHLGMMLRDCVDDII